MPRCCRGSRKKPRSNWSRSPSRLLPGPDDSPSRCPAARRRRRRSLPPRRHDAGRARERTPERAAEGDDGARARKAIQVGEKTAAKIVAAIDASRSRSLDRVIQALGIRHVGESAARLLARKFGSLDALVEADEAALTDIDGIGPEMASSIVLFLSDPSNHRMLTELEEVGLAPKVAAAATSGPLAGKSVVLTGSISIPRSRAKDLIQAAGGNVASSISAKVDYLVAGADPGSKLGKAEAGVAVIDETELFRLLGRKP